MLLFENVGALGCHWINQEKYLGTIQWSILVQSNPWRYCKQFHMTARNNYYRHVSASVGLQFRKTQMSTVSNFFS